MKTPYFLVALLLSGLLMFGAVGCNDAPVTDEPAPEDPVRDEPAPEIPEPVEPES